MNWKKASQEKWKLTEETKEIGERLAEIRGRLTELDEIIIKDADIGTHKYKKFVVNIVEKTKNGRISTSWKKVAESIEASIEDSRQSLAKRHPDWVNALGSMSRKMTKAALAARENNTSSGAGSKIIEVQVLKID